MQLATQTRKSNQSASSGPIPERRFINETQLSELTGVAVRTWQKKRVLGGGPPYRKIGGSVRYDLAEVFQWIDSGTRTGAAA